MTLTPTDDPDVFHNADEHRYEIYVDEQLAGFATYVADGDHVIMTHTEIEPDVKLKGLGTRLVKTALDDLRRQHKTVEPRCPFVAAYIRRHPDYADLVDG
ncbi:MAG: gcn5-related n-acetyltransferase [Acidimicrobiaceae bacterium]|nr:gcn5-related n-acetyltransferase [Acidimicrobiaceae bacterium]